MHYLCVRTEERADGAVRLDGRHRSVELFLGQEVWQTVLPQRAFLGLLSLRLDAATYRQTRVQLYRNTERERENMCESHTSEELHTTTITIHHLTINKDR